MKIFKPKFMISKIFLNFRYHFAGSEGKHYERRPYKSKAMLKLQITRFVALANVGNAEKEKYLYAFNINPGEEAGKEPEDCTETPFPDETAAKQKGLFL